MSAFRLEAIPAKDAPKAYKPGCRERDEDGWRWYEDRVLREGEKLLSVLYEIEYDLQFCIIAGQVK